MEKAMTAAFVNTNIAMHAANFDDSLSGTTGITIFMKGDTMYVANVGDSRAIIGTKNDEGVLRALPLSIDQTPFRKDERERLKKRVCSHLSY
jgi:serine/threonine protein phosphatase PrpC